MVPNLDTTLESLLLRMRSKLDPKRNISSLHPIWVYRYRYYFEVAPKVGVDHSTVVRVVQKFKNEVLHQPPIPESPVEDTVSSFCNCLFLKGFSCFIEFGFVPL